MNSSRLTPPKASRTDRDELIEESNKLIYSRCGLGLCARNIPQPNVHQTKSLLRMCLDAQKRPSHHHHQSLPKQTAIKVRQISPDERKQIKTKLLNFIISG